jgi:predicted lipase
MFNPMQISFSYFLSFSGFWEAYAVVRSYLHEIVRRELKRQPSAVYCTGHSLGGALATFAALDISIHTIPRVNAYLRHQEK